MRRFSKHILLHVVCVLTLIVACGAPEALHELGHVLTHSVCAQDAVSSLAARHPSATHNSQPSVRAPEETCLLAQCAAALSHLAGAKANSLAFHLSLVPLLTGEIVSMQFASKPLTDWSSPRGPPVV